MVVALFTISSGITDAQLNIKKLKNKAKPAVAKEETKEQDPALIPLEGIPHSIWSFFRGRGTAAK